MHFQCNILCFYHASISSFFSQSPLLKLLKQVKLIAERELFAVTCKQRKLHEKEVMLSFRNQKRHDIF